MATPQPVFIDFEGIDGSGKTTLSNRLAEYLKSQSVPVHHARDKGVFRSKISRALATPPPVSGSKLGWLCGPLSPLSPDGRPCDWLV